MHLDSTFEVPKNVTVIKNLSVVLLQLIVFSSQANGNVFENTEIIQKISLSGPISKTATSQISDKLSKSTGSKIGTELLYPRFDLMVADTNLKCDFQISGNTSLAEQDLPKIKMKKIKSASEGDSAFKYLNGIKFVTHGFNVDSQMFTSLGRLMNSVAVYRNALIYDFFKILEIPTSRYFRASITYTDTSEVNAAPVITKPALGIEDADKTAKLIEAERFRAESSIPILVKPDPEDYAKLALAQALIGNWDWSFLQNTETGEIKNQHNIEIFYFKEQNKIILMPEDFDLAAFVTGQFRRTPQMSLHFFSKESQIFRWIAWGIQQARFNPALKAQSFQNAIEEFKKEKSKLLNHIIQLPDSLIDSAGRKNALEHVHAFYQIIESDSNLHIPFIEASQMVPLFSNAQGTKKVADLMPNTLLQIIDENPTHTSVLILSGKPTTSKFNIIYEGWVRNSDIRKSLK